MHLYRAPLWKHLDLTMRNQQKSIRVYCNAMHNWPTILMHLAAPKSLMKRTQNRAVNKVTLHINIQYHISPSWTSYHSNIHIHPDIVDLYEE
jgi:hypothetical protein